MSPDLLLEPNSFYLDGFKLPSPHVGTESEPIENATDVQTLSGEMYTDYISLRMELTLSWSVMHQDDYEILYSIYRSQFECPPRCPLFTTTYCTGEDITDEPVRLKLNARDNRRDCCEVHGVELIVTLKRPVLLSQTLCDSFTSPGELVGS